MAKRAIPPTNLRGIGTQSQQMVLQQRQVSAPLPAGVSGGLQGGCSGQRVGGLTVKCQEQWVLGE